MMRVAGGEESRFPSLVVRVMLVLALAATVLVAAPVGHGTAEASCSFFKGASTWSSPYGRQWLQRYYAYSESAYGCSAENDWRVELGVYTTSYSLLKFQTCDGVPCKRDYSESRACGLVQFCFGRRSKHGAKSISTGYYFYGPYWYCRGVGC